MRTLHLVLLPTLIAAAGSAAAQQSIGTVGVQDATVSGELSITNGRAILVGSSTVVAKDHTAEVALNRGGTVRVCATSGLHLTQGQTATGTQPLLLALDRGAIEVQTPALANDVVMTPDLRFAVRYSGPLDLRLRVTRNGDTCVENHGLLAPALAISDQFGDSSYELSPGQHVLFEHGSLKEVVDHETSPCGCPAPTPDPSLSIAEALLAPGSPGTSATVKITPATPPSPAASTSAADQHPFPSAVSQGLAPAPSPPPASPGVTHTQVAATLAYAGDGTGTIAGAPVIPAPTTVQPARPSSAPAKTESSNPFRSIGHFFRRLFGGS